VRLLSFLTNSTAKPIDGIMDVEKLHVVLQQSFSPDASLRGPAEETIRNLKHVKGATIMLLQVAAEKQVSLGAEFSTPPHRIFLRQSPYYYPKFIII
jgi:hypothetical protein